MLNGPFPPWPNFTQEEADAVASVLLSNKVNYWTGQEGREFEKEFAAECGTEHAIAVGNGTLALDLALHGLGIGVRNGGSPDDEVIVTPRSFMASASAIVNAGARPVFADVGLDSQNIEAETVSACLSDNTRAVLCVHLAGWPCDMDAIREVVAGRDIKLIEDCAQAHGARYKGQPVGGLGDIGAWSFCQDKIMTTGGEGGMVTCNDIDLWKRMWAHKDHGKSWDAVYEREHPPGFRWLHESFGTNWRLTEMQSAIGRIQLRRLSGWTDERRRNAQVYHAALAAFTGKSGPVREPVFHAELLKPGAASNGMQHGWYRFYAFVRPENLRDGWDRDRIASEISAQGVPCMQGSCSEMYREKAFDGTGFRPHQPLPNSQVLGETSLMFLTHPGITADNHQRIKTVLKDVLGKAAR